MKSIRKLVLASMMLIVALFAVVASTFAWFTIQANPQIDEFNVDITSGEGLQISLNNGTNYQLIWTANEFLDAISGSAGRTQFLSTFRLDTVTPVFSRDEEGLSFGNSFQRIHYNNPPFPWEEGFDASKNGHYTYESVTPNISNVSGSWVTGQYLQFDILFRADTALNIFVAAAEIDSTNQFAKDSARFGFLSHTNTAGVFTPNLESFRIFNPNTANSSFGSGTFFTLSNLRSNFRALYQPSSVDSDVIRLIESSTPGIYQLAIEDSENPGTFVYDAEYVDHISDITIDYTTPTPLFSVPQFTGSPAQLAKLTVFVWLEGWDGQALDQAKGRTLEIFLRFTGYQSGETPDREPLDP